MIYSFIWYQFDRRIVMQPQILKDQITGPIADQINVIMQKSFEGILIPSFSYVL